MDYFKADESVLELVKEIVAENHQRLDGANIAVIMRERAQNKGGKVVFADASLVSEKLKPLLAEKVQFVLTIADNEWPELTKAQRRALIDHELCHCTFNDQGKPKLRPHDMECFAEVIERHGLWRPDQSDAKVQQAFQFEGVKVGTLRAAGE